MKKDLTDYTDVELIEKAKGGDQNAFRRIVLRYEKAVFIRVQSMLGNVAEVEDIAQEVFIRFYKNMHQFRGDAQLKTYLTKIAMNLSLNEIQRKKRKSWLHIFKPADEEDTKKAMQIEDREDKYQNMETKEIVNLALQYMPEDLRSVLVLRMVDEYSTKETAEILDIPLGTVLSKLSRARNQFKDILLKLGAV